MDSGLWAKADNLVKWRDELHKLRDAANALIDELGDMQCFRVSVENGLGLGAGNETPPGLGDHDFPEEPIYQNRRSPVPEQPAVAEPAKPAAPKQRRVSYPALLNQLKEEHGPEVVAYAVTHLCGEQRTAENLRKAMKGFLGTFENETEAVRAFAAEHETAFDCPEDVTDLLPLIKHKIYVDGCGVAIWREAAEVPLPAPATAAPTPEPKAKSKAKKKPRPEPAVVPEPAEAAAEPVPESEAEPVPELAPEPAVEVVDEPVDIDSFLAVDDVPPEG